MTFQLSNIDQVCFEQGMSYSDFLEQFQNYASQLLCLIDGKLHYYDKKENIPKNIHPTTSKGNQYYFEDNQGKKYTVFGIDAANLFYPIKPVKSAVKSGSMFIQKPKISETPTKSKPIIIEYIKDDLNLIIYHDQKYEFPRSNKILEIRKGTVFD